MIGLFREKTKVNTANKMEEMTVNSWLSQTISPRVFRCLEIGATTELAEFTQDELLPFLPILARSCLLQPESLEGGGGITPNSTETLTAILEIERMNHVVNMLSVDFLALEIDLKKELQLRY